MGIGSQNTQFFIEFSPIKGILKYKIKKNKKIWKKMLTKRGTHAIMI